MPPKITFGKDEIINAALSLVQREGIEKCTARNIAGELNSSTQPIYRVFSTIADLEREVIKRAKQTAVDTMAAYEDEKGHFLSIGLGYLAFAEKEPCLFNLVFMSGKSGFPLDGGGGLLAPLYSKMRGDPYLSELDEPILHHLLMDMFIYTHGLATLSVLNRKHSGTERREREEGENKKRLLEMGGKLIALAILNARDLIDFNTILGEECDDHCRT